MALFDVNAMREFILNSFSNEVATLKESNNLYNLGMSMTSTNNSYQIATATRRTDGANAWNLIMPSTKQQQDDNRVTSLVWPYPVLHACETIL